MAMDPLRDESLVMRLMDKVARVRIGEVALINFERLAAKLGVDEEKLLQLYIRVKNAAYRRRFIETPHSQRVILLPQCLRPRDCPGERTDYGYRCVRCGRCMVQRVVDLAGRLGYKGVYILSGGSVVKRVLAEAKPQACLGVACLNELVLGSLLTEKMGVVAQGVKLTRDGCVETAVDWSAVMEYVKLFKVGG